MEEIMNQLNAEAQTALREFTTLANRETGYSHPRDFERWCKFVLACYTNGNHPDDGLLSDWLLGNGWQQDMVDKLVIQFNYSISLLNKYNK